MNLTISALAAAAATVLTLSACGSSTAATSASSSAVSSGSGMMSSSTSMQMSSGSGTSGSSMSSMRNSADSAFTASMISSNQQAVQMAMLGVTRAKSPKVRALAAKIAADHGSEITMMNGWRKSWGMPMMTPGSTAHMGSIGAGMLNGEGMMNGADMTSLSRLSGGAFDKRFLAMMTVNHAGAVRMAHREQGAGKDTAAKRALLNQAWWRGDA